MPIAPADRAGRSARPGHRWWRLAPTTWTWEGSAMKISMFHLMPHRELPADFEQKYKSVWVDPPFPELADASRVGQYYNWTLDELTYAAQAGLDGICVNEHHQNAYGFMPGPNLMGSALARATNGLDVGIVQMGATLPTTNPPIRIAEEYAMIDCISGGRLIAGMPLGSPMDANMVYGIPPIEQRDRYYEAHDLIIKAWTEPEMFAWNGKYQKLGMVNLWPRPDPAAAPAGVGAGERQPQHLGLRRQARPLLLLPQLLREQPRQEGDGRLLGVRRHHRARRQPASRRISPAGRRRRHRCASREGVRRAHQVLLRQVPPHPAELPRAARAPGLPQHGARHPLRHGGPHGQDAGRG